jgi:hypothetical protein
MMETIKNIISQNGNVITRRDCQEPTKSQGNISPTKLKILIPLSNTIQTPREIAEKYLDSEDIAAMTKYISDYQRTEPEWKLYRKKIPGELLEKWGKVFTECREEGFCNPHVFKNKIIWNRMMEFDRNKNNIDKCTLCLNTIQAGTCKGSFKFKKNGNRFTPCWAEN